MGGDEPDNHEAFRLEIGDIGISFRFGLGILGRVVSCSGIFISLAGLGWDATDTVGDSDGVGEGIDDDSGHGTEKVGRLV